jgi:predicted DNA-binding transcriptional regulator AlpA
MKPIENHYPEAEVSSKYKVARATLRKRRWLGLEPRYVKLSRSVRYPESALIEWAKKGGK